MRTTPAERGLSRRREPHQTCPLCFGGKQSAKPWCPDCFYAIDRLQDQSRHQLKTKLTGLLKEVALTEAALAYTGAP